MLPTVSPATQAPGGLLVAGELPGAPVIGELGPAPRQRAHHSVRRPGEDVAPQAR